MKRYHVSKNLFDIEEFATQYPNDCSYQDDTLDVQSPGQLYATGITVDIPANTTFSCVPIDKTNAATNARIRFIYTDDTSNEVYLTNAQGEAVTDVTFAISKALKSIRFNWSTFNNGFKIKFAMINTGSMALPYEPYGNEWQTKSPPKYGTATETIQSGDTIYANGQPISTYSIKGNTVQSGTPTPSNPVEVQGVGNKTANLFDIYGTYNFKASAITITNGTIVDTYQSSGAADRIYYDKVYSAGTYTISLEADNTSPRFFSPVQFSGGTYNQYYNGYFKDFESDNTLTVTFTTDFTIGLIFVGSGRAVMSKIMLVNGSTPLPYEPYGYKIPILNNSQTTNIYLSEQLMKINDYADSLASSSTASRIIAKYVITGNENMLYNAKGNNVITVIVTPTNFNGTTEYTNIICNTLETRSSPQAVLDNTGICMRSTGLSIILGYLYTTVGIDGTETQIEMRDKVAAYLAQQYSNGTPVTVYYVLATPTTETVTAPSISTTQGANSITVDTTVQPSEFSATWTGWHNASVKEYDGSDWQ